MQTALNKLMMMMMMMMIIITLIPVLNITKGGKRWIFVEFVLIFLEPIMNRNLREMAFVSPKRELEPKRISSFKRFLSRF